MPMHPYITRPNLTNTIVASTMMLTLSTDLVESGKSRLIFKYTSTLYIGQFDIVGTIATDKFVYRICRREHLPKKF